MQLHTLGGGIIIKLHPFPWRVVLDSSSFLPVTNLVPSYRRFRVIVAGASTLCSKGTLQNFSILLAFSG